MVFSNGWAFQWAGIIYRHNISELMLINLIIPELIFDSPLDQFTDTDKRQ